MFRVMITTFRLVVDMKKIVISIIVFFVLLIITTLYSLSKGLSKQKSETKKDNEHTFDNTEESEIVVTFPSLNNIS